MSEAAEVPEPPRPTPEEMAEIRAAIERLNAVPRRHPAGGTGPAPRRAAASARYVDGVIAVLRVDPDTATAAFDMRIVDEEFREVIHAAGHGMLGIWVLKERQIVAVTHLTWLG